MPWSVTRGLSGYQQAVFLALIVGLQRPYAIAEVGTSDGDVYSALCTSVQNLALPTTCHSFRNVPTGIADPNGRLPEFEEFRQRHDSSYSAFSTLDESGRALTLLDGLPIDLLSITGDMTYEEARRIVDICIASSSERLVVLCDRTSRDPNTNGVARLWQDLAGSVPTCELRLGDGLGLAAPSGVCPQRLACLFDQPTEDWHTFERFVALVGECTFDAASVPDDSPTTPISSAPAPDPVRDALIGRLAARNAELDRAMTRTARESENLHQALASAWQNLADVVGSTSWRITEPLRRFKELARRLGPGGGTPHDRAPRLPARAYDEWVLRFDTLTDIDRELLRSDIALMRDPPTFSIVMPVYDIAARHLQDAIESVLAQLYPHWELCIADDASPSPHVRTVLDRYAARDSRIRVAYRETNGHISAASNTALGLATGDYVAFLDHDDELAEHALYVVAKEITIHPDAEIIYTDEDRLDEHGRRFGPHFKPDFNPELLYGQNYVTHLCVYRRSLVTSLGGFREGFEGSQDYDLLLRAVAQSSPSAIRHIARVLYHWRVLPGSVAHTLDAKPYAAEAGRRAVEDRLRNLQAGARVTEGASPVIYRPHFPLPEPFPLVSIIIPTRNNVSLLRTCVTSVMQLTSYHAYEVIIIDNGSDDPATLAYLKTLTELPLCRVVQYDAPFNYAAMNNVAVREAAGEFVLLLNNDTEVLSPEWLYEMVMWGVRPGVGTVGAKLLYQDGTLQHGGMIMGIGGIAGHGHRHAPQDSLGYFGRLAIAHQVGGNTGACLLIRRSVYLSHGGLDEEHLAVSYNDVDLCLRLTQAGLRHIWTPYALLYHYETKSRGSDEAPRNRARAGMEREYMTWRWKDSIMADPSYNPNLTLDGEDFAIAFPPRIEPLASLAEQRSETPVPGVRD